MTLFTRRSFLRQALVAGAATAPSRSQDSRPNVLLILADDLGWGDVGFNGRKTWSTPNLDRLAKSGTRFTRFYSGAAVCNPARACLMTGKYGIHNGVKGYGEDLPSSEVTLAEALRNSGYDTAMCGKWHSGKLKDGTSTHPLDQGFGEFFGFTNAIGAWQHFPGELQRGRTAVKVEGYTADLFSKEAVRFISRKRTNAFFLYLAYTEPHSVIEAPPEDVSRLRTRFQEKDPAQPWNAAYAAMIERLDRGIGEVLDALDRSGQAGNTIVIFASDQGATFEPLNQGASQYHDSNFPLRGQKRTLEEGGIRVPGIVRWPGQATAGKVCEIPVHFIDIFPTIVAAAGGRPDPAWKVDGANLLEVWRGKAPGPERTLFWEWAGDRTVPGEPGALAGKSYVAGLTMHAAMRGDFKLLEINGARFMFNVVRDPGERRSVAMEYPELFQSLKAELDRWKSTEVKR